MSADILFSYSSRAECSILYGLILFSPIWGLCLYFSFKKKWITGRYIALILIFILIVGDLVGSIWPDDIIITSKQIEGRCQFKQYKYDHDQILSMETTSVSKFGRFVLVRLTYTDKNFGIIPYVQGPKEHDFKESLLIFCKSNNIKLTWDNKVIFQPQSPSNENK